MAIFKETDRTQPVEIVRNLTIDSQCLLRGDVRVSDLEPVTGPNTYEVWVQRDAIGDVGTSIADVGVMVIVAD
jgi:hypothetical protein